MLTFANLHLYLCTSLFFHGYDRYKNFLFTIPQFFYAFENGFSGQTLYDDWYVSLYNLIFTACPLLYKALIEQDITQDDEEEEEFIRFNICKTYYLGRESLIFNILNFVKEVVYSLIAAVITYFFILNIMNYSIPLNELGETADLWSLSITQFSTIIFVKFF